MNELNVPIIDIKSYISHIYMSLLNDENKPAWDLCTCKEYILDYTLYTLVPSSSSYMREKNKVYLDEVRLIVVGSKGRAINALTILNIFEDVLRIPHTFIQKLDSSQSTVDGVLFRGHKTWFIAPPMLSLFALIIRSGWRYYEIGQIINEFLDMMVDTKSSIIRWDTSHFTIARPGIERILKHGWEAIFGADQRVNWKILKYQSIHNSGICSFGAGTLSQDYPNWYCNKYPFLVD